MGLQTLEETRKGIARPKSVQLGRRNEKGKKKGPGMIFG